MDPFVSRPAILLAMITVGQGHKTAADALAAHIERIWPGRFDVEILDFTSAVGDLELDRRHKASWDAMLARPWTAYWGQRLIDTVVPVGVSRAVQGAMLDDHARHAAPFIASRGYDLVIATHFFTVQALGMARARHGLAVPVVGINPDPLDSHALWAEPRVTEMVVFSEAAARDLTRRGVPDDRVSVFPYLMRPEFPPACDREETRRALDLDPEAFTVVHSAGGQGIGGNVMASVDAVMALGLDLEYVVICGRNEALRERVAERAARHGGPGRLRATGFVTNMPEWVCASDVMVGKAGPASTFEALISGRPVLHTSFAAANEKAVLDFCVKHGVGAYVPHERQLADRVRTFAQDPAHLAEIHARIDALGLQNGGPELARHLVDRYFGEPANGAANVR